MENLVLAFNVVLPLFLLMALGYGIRCLGLVEERTLQQMNGLVFKVFLPIMVFYNIYTTELKEALNIPLMAFATLCVIGTFLSLVLITPWIEKDPKKQGVLIQGLFRSNFMIFGIPIITSLYGADYVGSTALLVGIIIPIFNVLSVVALERCRAGRMDKKKVVIQVIKNPFIISSLIGLMILILNIKLPGALEKTLADLSKAATPLALVILGGMFKFSTINEYKKQIVIGVSGRLLIIPAILIGISVAVGFRNVELATLMVVFSSPVSVSSFAMAEHMEGDYELAGHLVIFGALFSVLTLFLWIFLLKQLLLL